MPAPTLQGGPCPPRLTVSFFPDVFAQHPITRAVSWASLAERLGRFPLREDVADKRRLPCWSPASLTAGTAATAVRTVTCLVLDIDDGADMAAALDRCAPYTVALHTSWRHTADRARFRLVLPLARPVPGGRWTEVWRCAVEALDLPVDRSCSNANRRYLLPARPAPDAPTFAEVRTRAVALDLLPLLPPEPAPRPQRRAAGRPVVVPRHQVDRAVRHRLATDPVARSRLAGLLGAAIRGEGPTQRAEGLACPACGRASVWFLVAPERATRARCKHRNSCGWSGPVTELCGRAA